MSHEPPKMEEIAERNIHAVLMHHRPDGQMLEVLMPLYAAGALQLPNIESMSVDSAAEAHRKLETWHVQGKVVLEVAEL